MPLDEGSMQRRVLRANQALGAHGVDAAAWGGRRVAYQADVLLTHHGRKAFCYDLKDVLRRVSALDVDMGHGRLSAGEDVGPAWGVGERGGR